MATLGCIVLALGVNVFTTPLNLYTTGLMGYSQFIRSILMDRAPGRFQNIDIAGILYYILSLPIFVISFKALGKGMFFRTIISSLVYSLATAFIPVPKTPIVQDSLTAVIVGGLLVGVGDGMVLTAGCTVGGLDLLAMVFSKRTGLQVGNFTILSNILLFILCFLRYDFSTVLYSIILMGVGSYVIDKMHQQSINLQVLIVTKRNDESIEKRILSEIQRGVTRWNGVGAYTESPVTVLCTCVNRYEFAMVERIVKAEDSHAFIVSNTGVHITGNYQHKV